MTLRCAALTLLVAASGCGPETTGPRTLWLNVPRDGLVVLQDREPPPF